MAIRLENVYYTYTMGGPFEKTALNGVSLQIEEGEFYGIIGHTGSGKSTFVQLLNGLLSPSSGKIFYDGKDISDKSFSKKELRKKVGLCFQYPEYQLFEETVYKDMCFGPKNLGYSDEKVKELVYNAMEMVGVKEELLQKSPFELSGGQKRRVAIAGVLAMNPSYLILDEPTAGLDPHGRDSILKRIKRLHKEMGITVLLVSHSMEDVARVASRVIVLDKGKIDFTGTVHEVFERGERLKEIGLDIPQVTSLMIKLKNAGYNVDSSIYTVESAKEQLLSLIGGDFNA